MNGAYYITYWEHYLLAQPNTHKQYERLLRVCCEKIVDKKYEAIGSDQINQTRKEEKNRIAFSVCNFLICYN